MLDSVIRNTVEQYAVLPRRRFNAYAEHEIQAAQAVRGGQAAQAAQAAMAHTKTGRNHRLAVRQDVERLR